MCSFVTVQRIWLPEWAGTLKGKNPTASMAHAKKGLTKPPILN